MAKEVRIVTTKPELNQAEYAIYENGMLLRHGEKIDFDIGALTVEQQQALGAARAVLLGLAQDDAELKGLI